MLFRKYSVLIGLLLTSLTVTGFSGPFQAAQQRRGIPWYVWVLIILVLLVLLIWWWQRRRPEEEAASVSRAEVAAPAAVAEAPAPPTEEPTPDDLKRIEGIGPKISSLLQAAGILTFAQLAEADVSQLNEILAAAGLGALADPTTWPQQAGLAAAGEWDALESLQEKLKGGRRA
jgi:predicted flap endonuclease-1-like 5' DNA nuclease